MVRTKVIDGIILTTFFTKQQKLCLLYYDYITQSSFTLTIVDSKHGLTTGKQSASTALFWLAELPPFTGSGG